MNAPPKKSAPGTGGTEGKALTSFPKTIASRDGLQAVTVDHHAEVIQRTSDRLECLKLIAAIAGTVRAFFDTPQPALGDMTGRELLDECPSELLDRLRELERGAL